MRNLYLLLLLAVVVTNAKAQSTLPVLRVQIYPDSVSSAASADGFVVVFKNIYSNSVVLGEDATKLANPNLNLGVFRDANLLAIEKRKLPNEQDSIPFKLTGCTKTNWAFKIEHSNANFTNLTPVLIDYFTNTEHVLNGQGQTIIPFSMSSTIPASTNAYRFTIKYRPLTSLLPVVFSSVKASQVNNGVSVEWQTEAETNIDKYLVEKSVNAGEYQVVATVAAKNNNNGYKVSDNQVNGTCDYRIVAVGIDGKLQYSKVVRLSLLNRISMSVYPNPCTGKDVTVYLDNYVKGAYVISLFSNDGRVVASNTININSSNQQQKLQLPNASAKGLYTIVVSGHGKHESMRLLVQ